MRKRKQRKKAKNILEISNNTPSFRVQIETSVKSHSKNFKTLEEAIAHRDAKRKELGLCRVIDNVPEGQKHCQVCDEVKAAEEFYKAKKNPDGLHTRCKSCQKKYESTSEVKARQNELQKERYGNDPLDRLDQTIRNHINKHRGVVRIDRREGGTAASWCNVSSLEWLYVHYQRLSTPEMFDAWWNGTLLDGEPVWIDHIYPRAGFTNPILDEYVKENCPTDLLDSSITDGKTEEEIHEWKKTNYIFSHSNQVLIKRKDNIVKGDSLTPWMEANDLTNHFQCK